MLYKLMISLFAIITLASCSVNPMYDVYVLNSTDNELTVSYKSSAHKDGPIENAIQLKPQERLLLISTAEVKNTSGRTTADDCAIVAEYIKVLNSNEVTSSVSWCSDAVQFAVVDIGQGEFTLDIQPDSF